MKIQILYHMQVNIFFSDIDQSCLLISKEWSAESLFPIGWFTAFRNLSTNEKPGFIFLNSNTLVGTLMKSFFKKVN